MYTKLLKFSESCQSTKKVILFSSAIFYELYAGYIQVNLFQKYLFLHQLTHNMTKDCSLNYEFSTWKLLVFVLTFRTIYVHNMFWTCNFHVLKSKFNEQSFVILWVSWCKNKSKQNIYLHILLSLMVWIISPAISLRISKIK